MSEFDFEQISVFLPQYLSPREQRGLFEQIKAFPEKISFYDPSAEFRETLLQGDGWRGLIAIDFETLEKKAVAGVVISNSCDINNQADSAPNILFAPLVRVTRFADMLKNAGKDEQYIESRLDVIRRQQISSLFYFPRLDGVIDESVILLDDLHRHPLPHFLRRERVKLFTLTQVAFYLFLIKLSIHFHRINEGAHRHIPDTVEPASSDVENTSSGVTYKWHSLKTLAANFWKAVINR